MGRSFIHINENSHKLPIQLSIIKISLIWLLVTTIVHFTNLGAQVVADNSTVPLDACFPLIYSASLADGRHLPAWLSFSSSDRTFSGVPSSSDIGQLMVRITAQDTHGASSITDFFLNVAAPGQSNEITDKVVTIPSTIELTIYAQSFPDLDNQTVVMNSSLADSSPLPPWLSFFPTNNTFLGAPSVSDAGEYLVRVRAQDQNNGVQLADFKILVNRRPVVLTPLGNHMVTANQRFQYTIQVPTFFQDPDDNSLMLYVSRTDGTPLPSWLSFSSNTFSGTPLLSDSGYLQIVVRASDGYVSVESIFSIFVNQPPYIMNRIPDRLINAGTTVQFVIPSNSFSDNDSPSLELHTQMNNGDVLPNWLTFFGNNQTFVAQPPNNIHGPFLVEVSAIDSFGASTSSSFVLTVNRPPVLNMSIPVLSVTIGGVVTYKIPSNTFYDPDGSSLTISIVQQDGSPLPSWLTFNPISNSFFGFPDTLDAGEWHLNVSATDGAAYVSTDLSLIVNRKPQINNLIPPQHVTIGSTFVYQIDDSIFVDPDNNTLTLTASKANLSPLPLWLLFFNSNNTFFGVPGVSDYGAVMIRVTASDNFSSIYVDFQLRVNRAPLLVNPVADQVVNVQHSLLYTVPFNTFFDSDNDVLFYSASLTNGSNLPSWLQFNPSTRRFTGFPLTEDVGNYNLLLTADDGMSQVTSSFNIQVNQGPVVINYPGAQIVVVGTRKEFNVHDVFLSLDGYSLDLTAGLNTGDILPIWISFDSSKSKFIFTPTVVSNPIVIKLRAADPYSSLSVLFSVISQCPIGYRGEACQTFDCYSILSTNSTVCSSRGNCTAPDTCTCSTGYAGSNCDRTGCFGVPWNVRGVCSGHGTCTGPNQCVCKNGWLNYDCSLTKCNGVLNTNSSVCSGVGACIAPNYCDCPLGYSGSKCQDYSCFEVSTHLSYVCAGNGQCDSPDVCVCKPGYYGLDCSFFDCFGVSQDNSSVCNGRGACVAPDICSCSTGYSHPDCSDYSCFDIQYSMNSVCSAHGVCTSFNNCTCHAQYYGLDCSDYKCYDNLASDISRVCSGHGVCVSHDNCTCSDRYNGNDCSEYECYGVRAKNATVCSGHGVCSGIDRCTCDPDYIFTLDCSRTRCFGKFDNDSAVCNGRGSCTGINTCSCISGYAGSNCELHACSGIEFTSSHVCSGHGKCLGPNNCSCYPGYQGTDCSVYSCFGVQSTEPSVCSSKGVCIANNLCACLPGYEIMENCSRTKCFEILDNSSSVCSGQGDCIGYNNCICDSGYLGDNCYTHKCHNVFKDDKAVCSGHGSCVSPDHCFCSLGYSGYNCSKYTCYGVDYNNESVCSSNGVCVSPDNCQCYPGRLFSDCSRTTCFGQLDNETSVCSSNGRCTSKDHCNCNSGFGGEQCASIACFGVVLTDPSVCSEHGQCTGPNTCNCDTGYSGIDCSNFTCYNWDRYDANVCRGHGRCSNLNNCTCRSGYQYDFDCHRTKCYSIFSNESQVCSGNGSCVGPDECACYPGYGGAQCDQHTCHGVVHSNPGVCSSHGSCVGIDKCTCQSGYSGSNCSTYDCFGLDSTDVSACSGRGRCVSSHNCQCPVGYQIEKDCRRTTCFGALDNSSSVCSGRGRCIALNTCLCDSGYSGAACQDTVCFNRSSSDPKACGGHGVCVAPNDCSCEANYLGNDCSDYQCFGVHRTSSSVCSGHGVCTAINKCKCEPGYTLITCSQPVCYSMLSTNPYVCSSHGVCKGPDTCVCDTGYYNATCHSYSCFGVSSLDSINVCNGHGDCLAPDVCHCESGYYGSDCQVTSCYGVSSNSSSVCSDHGSCVSTDNCLCDDGFYGSTCELWSCFSKELSDLNVCSGIGTCVKPNTCACDTGFGGNECQFPLCYGYTRNETQVCNGNGYCESPNFCECSKDALGVECEVKVSDFVMSPDGNKMTATFNSKFNNGYEFEWGSRDNCNYILSNVSLLGHDTTCSIQNETLILVLGIFSSIQLYDVLEVRIYPKLPPNSSFQYPAHISKSLQDKLITQIQVQPNKSPIIPTVVLSVESTNVYDCAPVDLSVHVEIYSLKRTNIVLSSRHFDSETMNHMNYYLSRVSLSPATTSVHIPSSSFLISTKNRTAEFHFTLSVRSNLGYESESSITIQYTHLPLPVYKTKRNLILSRRSDDYMVETTPALATTCGNPNHYPTISEWLQLSGEPIVGFNSKEDRFNSSSFLLPPFFFPKVDESYQLTLRSALRDFPFVKSQLDIFVRVVSQELKALIGGADRAEPISSDVILKAIVSDPDLLDDAPDHFEWRCYDTRMLCPEDRHGLTLVIPAFSMLVGYKSFDFRYIKGNRETTASIQINVVAADFPIARIEGVPLNNRMNNYEGLQLLAVVENYPSSNVYFQWEVYRGGLLLNNSTMTTPSTTLASLSIRPNVMTPSARYGFRLTVFLKPDLAHLSYYGTPGVAEAEIQINTQPKDGPFTVTPSEGYALSTVFKLDCMGWQSDTQPYFFSFSFLDEINYSYNKSRMLSMTPTLREQLDVMLPQPTTRADHRLFIKVRVSDLYGATTERIISVIVKPHPTITYNTALNSILGNLTLIENEKQEEQVFGRDLAVLTFALNQVVSINQLNSSNNCTNDCYQSLGQGTCNNITTTCTCHQGYHGDDCSLTPDDVENRKNVRLTLLQQYSKYSEVPTMSTDHLNFRLQTLSSITSKVSELSMDMAILGSNFLNSTLSMNTAPMSETLVKETANVINNLFSVSLSSIDSRVSPIDSYQLSVKQLTSIMSLKETTDVLLSNALANKVQGQAETKLITSNLKACIFKDYASLLDGKTISIVNDGSSPMSPPQTQQILTIPKGFGTEMISKFNSSTGEKEPTIGLRIVSLIVNPHDTRSHARSRKDRISSDLLSIVFEVNGVATSMTNLTNMIEFIVPGTYSYNDDPSLPSSSRTAPLCKYWDHSKGVWSTEGVVTLKFSPTSTSCLTSHTTDFAVFVGQYIPPPPPSPSSQIHLPSDFEPSTLDRQAWNVFPWWWILVAALVSGCFVLGLMSVLVLVVGIMSRKRSHIEDDSYEDDEEGMTYEDMEGDEEIMRNHQRPHSNCSMESAHDDDMSSETRSHYLHFMYSRADSRASDLSLMAAPYSEQVADGREKRYQMTAKNKNESSAFFNKSMMMHEVEFDSTVMNRRRSDDDDDENHDENQDGDDDGATHWKHHVNNNDNSHESSTENLFVRMDSFTNSLYNNNDRYGNHRLGQLKKNQVAPHMDDDADSTLMDDGTDLSGPTPLVMDKRYSTNNNSIKDDDLMTEEEEESSSLRQPNKESHHEALQIPSSQQFRNFVVRYVDEEDEDSLQEDEK